jgi:hypothetical protein
MLKIAKEVLKLHGFYTHDSANQHSKAYDSDSLVG